MSDSWAMTRPCGECVRSQLTVKSRSIATSRGSASAVARPHDRLSPDLPPWSNGPSIDRGSSRAGASGGWSGMIVLQGSVEGGQLVLWGEARPEGRPKGRKPRAARPSKTLPSPFDPGPEPLRRAIEEAVGGDGR